MPDTSKEIAPFKPIPRDIKLWDIKVKPRRLKDIAYDLLPKLADEDTYVVSLMEARKNDEAKQGNLRADQYMLAMKVIEFGMKIGNEQISAAKLEDVRRAVEKAMKELGHGRKDRLYPKLESDGA